MKPNGVSVSSRDIPKGQINLKVDLEVIDELYIVFVKHLSASKSRSTK